MTDAPIDADVTSDDAAIRVVSGYPSDDELAAVVAVLGAAAGGSPAPAGGAAEVSRWGQPADALRFSVFSWQRVTLIERAKLKR